MVTGGRASARAAGAGATAGPAAQAWSAAASAAAARREKHRMAAPLDRLGVTRVTLSEPGREFGAGPHPHGVPAKYYFAGTPAAAQRQYHMGGRVRVAPQSSTLRGPRGGA